MSLGRCVGNKLSGIWDQVSFLPSSLQLTGRPLSRTPSKAIKCISASPAAGAETTAAPEPAFLVEEASEKPLSSGAQHAPRVLMFKQQSSLLSSRLPVVCSPTAATLRLFQASQIVLFLSQNSPVAPHFAQSLNTLGTSHLKLDSFLCLESSCSDILKALSLIFPTSVFAQMLASQ